MNKFGSHHRLLLRHHRRLLSSDVRAARALLGCEEGASRAEIKMAFRRAALKVHPDVNARKGATAEFQALSAAARTLLSPSVNAESTEEEQQHQSPPQRYEEEIPEWRRALRKILEGPELLDTMGEFPAEFEIEERNAGHVGPVLKLVHGRKEIGYVEETRLIGEDDAWRGRCLSLNLFGSVVATAVKMRGEITVCFRGRQQFFVLGPPLPGTTVLGLGGFAAHRIRSGITTHRLLESESPGVKNMLIHRCPDERLPNHVYHPHDVVVRCTRAWFPKREYWLPFFRDSRSPGYASDGKSSSVYVEMPRKRKLIDAYCDEQEEEEEESSPELEDGSRSRKGVIGQYLTRVSHREKMKKKRKSNSLTLTLTRLLVENRRERGESRHHSSSSSSQKENVRSGRRKAPTRPPPDDEALTSVCVFAAGFSVLRREG